MFKRCCVAVSLAVVLVAFSGLAWSAGDKSSKSSGPAIHTGTLVDPGIDALNLTDDAVRTKVVDALKTWTDANTKTKADLKQQVADLTKQMKDERAKGKDADKTKLADLKTQLDAVNAKIPSPADEYKSARDSLKDILTADQLTKIDDTAHAKMVLAATKTFDTDVKKWANSGVTLTPDEQAKVDAIKATIKDVVAKPDVGMATIYAVDVGNRLANDAKATLPQADQDKLGKKAVTSAPDRAKSKTGV